MRAHRVGKARGEPDQEPVAGGVAEGVVVLLEAVEVEEEQRARGGGARELELELEVRQQAAAVLQPGERVGARLDVGLGERALVLQEGERHAGQRQQKRPRGEAHGGGVHALEVVVHEQLDGHEPAAHRHGHDQPVLNRDLLPRGLPGRHGHEQRGGGPGEVEQRALDVLVLGALHEVERRPRPRVSASPPPSRSQTGSGRQPFSPKTATTRPSSSRSPTGYARFTAISAGPPLVASTIGWKASVAISAATVSAGDRAVEPEAAAEGVGARAGQQQQGGVAGRIEGEVEHVGRGRVGRVRIVGVDERPRDLAGGPGHEADAHHEPRRALLPDRDRPRHAHGSGGDDQPAVDPVLEEPVELRGAQPEGRMEHVCEQGKPRQRREGAQPCSEPG